MSKFSFLLLAGGKGVRTALSYPKQFHPINGHPMIAYALIAADKSESIDDIVVNAAPGTEEQTLAILKDYVADTPYKIVRAGETRQESTRLLLEGAKNEDVVLTEAARPIINAQRIDALVAAPHDNVSYCVPIAFSMCEVNPLTNEMLKSINRDRTLNIQLPQKFKRTQLMEAHRKAKAQGAVYYEDALLCREIGGFPVHYIEGWHSNIKITTSDDFVFADAIMKGVQSND